LDDCFCNDEVALALSAAGFAIEQFNVHFPRDPNIPEKREQGVKDPRVIMLSHRKGWLIVTADQQMRTAHVEVFKSYPNAMVLATAHHRCDDTVWVAAIIRGKNEIERRFKKQERPWYAQITQAGELSVCKTIDCKAPSKKKR
jgi:hypothetical protein